LVWIDAHGDCNTPETTLSGMLSGMPVAIATGLCLERFRRQAGLDPPLDPRGVVMVCVRANDPLEQELIDQSGIEIVPVDDIRGDRRKLHAAMERLSRDVDAIYVHFDADALDEKEVASMWLTAPDGPTAEELAAALRIVMAFPKVAAFGVADINPERDEEGKMVEAALSVAEAAMAGLSLRLAPGAAFTQQRKA
jgi:arginase